MLPRKLSTSSSPSLTALYDEYYAHRHLFNDSVSLYIFNFADSAGYAIMSSDIRVEPLLAFVLQGCLRKGDIVTNPGLETAITRVVYYAENKKNGSTNTGCIPVIEESPDREEYYDSKVYYGGNCYVQWGQGAPYNKYCPMIDGDHTVTGCVATAIAQLMSIYEYPCNYGSYDFSWNDINSEITPPEGVPEDQVAHLMEQLGLPQNLDMEYGVNGSGASPNRIPKTLENFGYSDGGNLIEYDTEEVVSDPYRGSFNQDYYYIFGNTI